MDKVNWRRCRVAFTLAALLTLVGLGTSGCAALLLTGAGAAGLAAAQERPIGQAIDDAIIAAQVTEKLLQKDEALFGNVNIEVLEARVLLTGVVPIPEDRMTAARLTWKIDGVREVLNEIQVNDKSSLIDAGKDAWITTQLKSTTLGDAKIIDLNYYVETINGIVYLLGIAQDRAELDRIIGHARNVKGVKKVVSHVIIKTDPRRK